MQSIGLVLLDTWPRNQSLSSGSQPGSTFTKVPDMEPDHYADGAEDDEDGEPEEWKYCSDPPHRVSAGEIN